MCSLLSQPQSYIRPWHWTFQCGSSRQWTKLEEAIFGGSRDTKGGHCLISWPKVTRAKVLGGLSISHLQSLNWALRVRWLWLKKTDPDKPWASFHLHSGQISQRLFDMAVATEIGDGTMTLFWLDRWVHGQ
jgi:hypothetical protein